MRSFKECNLRQKQQSHIRGQGNDPQSTNRKIFADRYLTRQEPRSPRLHHLIEARSRDSCTTLTLYSQSQIQKYATRKGWRKVLHRAPHNHSQKPTNINNYQIRRQSARDYAQEYQNTQVSYRLEEITTDSRGVRSLDSYSILPLVHHAVEHV